MTATIYALVDPRTGQTRYVGRTTSRLSARLGVHVYWCRTGRVKGPRGHWVRELLAADLRPRIKPLEHCSVAMMAERERHWIAAFRLSGVDLVNTR